jgi:hypothetical protein
MNLSLILNVLTSNLKIMPKKILIRGIDPFPHHNTIGVIKFHRFSPLVSRFVSSDTPNASVSHVDQMHVIDRRMEYAGFHASEYDLQNLTEESAAVLLRPITFASDHLHAMDTLVNLLSPLSNFTNND